MSNAQWSYKTRKYYLSLGLILFSSIRILLSRNVKFDSAFDPIVQTFIMYLGEFFCFIFIFIRKSKHSVNNLSDISKINISSKKTSELITWYQKYGWYCYIIPSICELITNVLEVICYNYLSSPMIVSLQMQRITFVMYYRFNHINRTFFKHQKLGMIIYIIGITTTLIEIILSNNTINPEKFIIIGIMLVAEFFGSLTLLTEEFLMNKLDSTPGEVNFFKGIFGLIMCLILYFPIGILLELFFQSSNYKDPFESLINTVNMQFFVITYTIAFCLSNFFVVANLKFTESLTVCTINSGRLVLVWIVTICININSFDPIEITGGLLIVFGILIYNEFIVIPWFGFKKSAQKSMEDNRFYKEENYKKKNIPDAFFLDPLETNLILSEKQ